MKLQSSNPVVGVIVCGVLIGLGFLLAAIKDTFWIVALSTIMGAAIGGFIAYTGSKNIMATAVIGAALFFIAGLAWYIWGV